MNHLVEPSLEVIGAGRGVPLEALGELDLIGRSHFLEYQGALLVQELVAQKMLSIHPFEQGADAALGIPLEALGELYLIGRSHFLEYQRILFVPLERLLTLVQAGTLQVLLLKQRSQEWVAQKMLSVHPFEQVADAG